MKRPEVLGLLSGSGVFACGSGVQTDIVQWICVQHRCALGLLRLKSASGPMAKRKRVVAEEEDEGHHGGNGESWGGTNDVDYDGLFDEDQCEDADEEEPEEEEEEEEDRDLEQAGDDSGGLGEGEDSKQFGSQAGSRAAGRSPSAAPLQKRPKHQADTQSGVQTSPRTLLAASKVAVAPGGRAAAASDANLPMWECHTCHAVTHPSMLKPGNRKARFCHARHRLAVWSVLYGACSDQR
jgi:hypothetical protein